MNNIGLIFIGILSIIQGCILMTRKKLVIKGEHQNIYASLIFIAPFIQIAIETIFYDQTSIIPIILISIVILLPFLIFSFNRERNTYYIENSSIQMVIPIITSILNEKDISYEEREKAIFLKGYDSSIYYKKSLDTIRLDFKDIQNISLQEEIIEELKRSIKENKSKIFPFSGFLFIGLGVLIFLVDKYI